MRVIAGQYGGRRLQSPPSATRPTADRVREALFSTLGPLDGLRVLDLFAGSGALAIESLSRGAAEAVLVDRDRRAARVAQANVDELGAGEAAQVLCAPASAAVARLAAQGRQFDLVFLDPPYAEAGELLAALEPALEQVTAPGGRVVVESDRRDTPGLDLPMVHERRYGDTAIRIFSARD
ncbi:MAG: 16S rRNA (guanine(966)-N(2))-methyltransferase RsmD [Solirubrobacterales bacterium]